MKIYKPNFTGMEVQSFFILFLILFIFLLALQNAAPYSTSGHVAPSPRLQHFVIYFINNFST